MANTRPFTYNNGSPISGTNQIGDLAYGDLNDVNGGPDYSQNPGGKKWWMGPDEDNRYIIGKDVPAMNHPTSTPEGDIGSVRFWGTDTESDLEFLFWFNRLPGRAGLGSVSDPSTAYTWLLSNGYFTNYPPVFSEFGTFYTYDSPTDSTPQAIGILYSSANNKLFIDTDNEGSANSKDDGNFVINNWTSTLANTISGSTVHYSGSSYSNQWLPSATQNGGSKRITSGFMAIDDIDDFLFIQGKSDSSAQNGKGIIKYDISVNPPTIEVSSSIDVPAGEFTKINHEHSSNLVISTNGADSGDNNRGFLFDGDTLDFEGYLLKNNSSIITSTRWAIPGPSGYILLTRELASDYYIFKLNSATNPNKAIDNGLFGEGYYIDRDTPEPIYVPSKNKWYVPYRKNSINTPPNATRSQGLDVIDDTTFNRTSYTFGSSQNTTGTNVRIEKPLFFLYDSIRDYFWTISPFKNIIAIDADDFSTQVTTETNGVVVGQLQSAVIVDDKLILIRRDSGNPIKIFDLASLVIV